MNTKTTKEQTNNSKRMSSNTTNSFESKLMVLVVSVSLKMIGVKDIAKDVSVETRIKMKVITTTIQYNK